MTVEKLKDETGEEYQVTYQQSSEMVSFAEECLLKYFKQFGKRRPGELEDDFCGQPHTFDIMNNLLGRWHDSPFFPALGRLVDKQLVQYSQDENGDIWYSIKE